MITAALILLALIACVLLVGLGVLLGLLVVAISAGSLTAAWIVFYEMFIDDGIEREPYREPRSPTRFGWRPKGGS